MMCFQLKSNQGPADNQKFSSPTLTNANSQAQSCSHHAVHTCHCIRFCIGNHMSSVYGVLFCIHSGIGTHISSMYKMLYDIPTEQRLYTDECVQSDHLLHTGWPSIQLLNMDLITTGVRTARKTWTNGGFGVWSPREWKCYCHQLCLVFASVHGCFLEYSHQ